MRKTSLLGAAVCALALAGLSTSPAFAAGQVERGPAHANSVCSYSGLNDTPNLKGPEGGRVQSYGQLVRAGLKADFPSPGVACNGHRSPFPPPPGSEVP
jgi:hypothetical protein